MNQTTNAMLQRGIDTAKAEELQSKGFNVTKLQAMTESALTSLGLNKVAIEALLAADRPPIPEDTLYRLIFECRGRCCRCRSRDPERGIIVHHLIPWHKSRSHDESNLIVLCTVCHDAAHTTKELTRSVGVKELRNLKEQWVKRVRELDSANVLRPMNFLVSPFWDYFNHNRLLEVAVELGFRSPNSSLAPDAESNAQFMYAGRPTFRNPVYYDNKELVEIICKRKGVVDIRGIWTAPQMMAILQTGTFIAMTGNFRFKGKNSQHGPGQIRTGYLKKQGIHLEFVFDAFECTSTSAWGGHLRGQELCTAICVVRSLQNDGDLLKLNCTVLAIGVGLGGEGEGDLPDDLDTGSSEEE